MAVLFLVPLVLALVVVMWGVGIYNGLVAARNRVKEAWAQVDVQLKRRFDLIPNLIETVKGYMQHERGTLEAVTQARAAISGAGNMAQRVEAEGGLSAALGRLFAVAEAYPDLKASTNFASLQEELASTENKIGFARQGYNDSVTEYNTARESFPDTIFASFFQFKSAELLQATESAEERQAVKVKF